MSDFKLLNEIDPEKKDQVLEKKQVRGFLASGMKVVSYLGSNEMTILEVPSGISYSMEFLRFRRLASILRFEESALDHSFSKLISYYDVMYDFDNYSIYIKKPEKSPSLIGQALKTIAEEYNPVTGKIPDDMNFDDWYTLSHGVKV